jgi:hypothetical protein
MGVIAHCTKCKQPTHLALLSGKPSHPHESDFTLLECERCYGEVQWFDGGREITLTWEPLCSRYSDLYNQAVELTAEHRKAHTRT